MNNLMFVQRSTDGYSAFSLFLIVIIDGLTWLSYDKPNQKHGQHIPYGEMRIDCGSAASIIVSLDDRL